MLKHNKQSGFSLVQVTLTVGAITALISTGIEPNLVERNEAAAIQTLRQIASAQWTLQAAGTIDTNGDGVGEFGYFGEMSGANPIRVNNGMGAPATGMIPGDLLNPSVLPTGFGRVWSDSAMDGSHWRGGYVFKIFLPSAAPLPLGTGEAVFGGASFPWPGCDAAEQFWCAYAFPQDRGRSGQRAFCIDQTGQIVSMANDMLAQSYSGQGLVIGSPSFSAAYSAQSMSAPLVDGSPGVDMNVWTAIP